jgi:hypothetical protein
MCFRLKVSGGRHSVGSLRKSELQLLDNMLNLKLSYEGRSVGQSILLSGHHTGPATIFFLFDGNYLQIFAVFYYGRTLSEERIGL